MKHWSLYLDCNERPCGWWEGADKEIGQKQSCVGAEHAKVADAHRKSEVSEWYHPVRVGFGKNSLWNPVDGYPLPGRIQVCYC